MRSRALYDYANRMSRAYTAAGAKLAVERQIHWVRGQRVMLDYSLGLLYGVKTGYLNLAVKRNRSRFPPDFMFVLTADEARGLLLQFATSNRGGRRTPPYAFTELGVAMLSSVLRNERAVRMNIIAMRAFVRLREQSLDDGQFRQKMERMADSQRRALAVMESLVEDLQERSPARRIGFAAGSRR